jgi:hypothetical protein
MGRVMAKLKLTNKFDEENVRRGLMAAKDVRSLEIEALVDTGATMLVLPADVVAKLGLRQEGSRPVRYPNGTVAKVPWVSGVSSRCSDATLSSTHSWRRSEPRH